MEIIPVQPPPKPFASGTMYRTIRQGPRGKDLDAKSLSLPSERSKNCCPPRKCLCRKPGSITVPSQYVQPARPKSFAPIQVWRRPEHKLEDRTIQKMSFQPVDGQTTEPFLPRHNIGMSCKQFATDTINRMSFPGHYNPCPAGKILPCNHDLTGRGPLTDMTTNRHDYVPKDVERAQPILPIHNLKTSHCPFSDKTINKMSYQDNNCVERVGPILPRCEIEWPKGKLEQNTVQKMSFQPCKIPRKEFLPWAQKKRYETPNVAFSCDTVYRKSYIPSGDQRREPIRPPQSTNLIGDGCFFEKNTIYGMSYPGNENFCRPGLILPSHNIHLSCQRMDGNTINRMSFQPNAGHCPPGPILPCNHDLMGKGPLTCMTTNRMDYTPMDAERSDPFLPKPQISMSCAPLSSKTINKMSFMDPGCQEVVGKILPSHNLGLSKSCMESNTIQKMSYQPVQIQDKERLPWAEKLAYCPPAVPFVADTVYRMSFDAPGEWGGGGSEPCACPPGGGCPCYGEVEVPLIG